MFYVIHNHLSRYKPDTRDACFSFFEMKKTFITTYKPLTSKILTNNKYINNKYFPLENSRHVTYLSRTRTILRSDLVIFSS